MKNKKKLFIAGGSCLAFVAVITLIVVLASSKPAPVTTTDTDSPVTESDVKEITVIAPTSDKDASDTLDFKVEKINDDGTGLNLDTDFTNGSDSDKKSAEKTSNVASPITPSEPKDNGNDNNNGGFTIGGVDEAYDCGTAGHHCDGPETHAYILNLEIEGCPYCGTHSCKSFYATDEWGNTCYAPSECSNYDIHKDPVYYCQDCGKPTGNGTNGTCVQFVNSGECEFCGEWVEAWTCHSCK